MKLAVVVSVMVAVIQQQLLSRLKLKFRKDMKIRRLERKDYPAVIAMGLAFAKETELVGWNSNELNHEHAKKILLSCELAGHSLVAEDDQGEIQGILLTIKDRDVWMPHLIRLKEVAWWVKPEHRKTAVGPMLFEAYITAAESMRASGEIISYTIGRHRYSPEHLETYVKSKGFSFLESTYIIGE